MKTVNHRTKLQYISNKDINSVIKKIIKYMLQKLHYSSTIQIHTKIRVQFQELKYDNDNDNEQ